MKPPSYHITCLACTGVTGLGGARHGASAADLEHVRAALAAAGGPRIPSNFTPTARGYDPKDPAMQKACHPDQAAVPSASHILDSRLPNMLHLSCTSPTICCLRKRVLLTGLALAGSGSGLVGRGHA